MGGLRRNLVCFFLPETSLMAFFQFATQKKKKKKGGGALNLEVDNTGSQLVLTHCKFVCPVKKNRKKKRVLVWCNRHFDSQQIPNLNFNILIF